MLSRPGAPSTTGGHLAEKTAADDERPDEPNENAEVDDEYDPVQEASEESFPASDAPAW